MITFNSNKKLENAIAAAMEKEGFENRSEFIRVKLTEILDTNSGTEKSVSPAI